MIMCLDKMFILCLLLTLCGVLANNASDSVSVAKQVGLRVCAKSGSWIENDDDGESRNSTNNLSGMDICGKETRYCYAFWNEDPENGTQVIIGQGCWGASGSAHGCDRNECISDRKPSKAMEKSMKFCCCSGDMCNVNFTNTYTPNSDVPQEELHDIKKSSIPFIWILPLICVISCCLGGMAVCYWKMNKPNKGDVEMGPHTLPEPPQYRLDELKLIKCIGQGRYGSVWRGIADDQEVAVKVFPAHHKNYFINEHEIYKGALSHPSLLKCFGGGERITPCGSSDYLLILSLEKECLQEYLKHNTLDMATMCKMSLGVAKGLAHLHSDIGKMCIAHRDLNTRNILVRHDLSCCICDLGLAVVSKQAENRALSEAGTLRYMAPEVLEHAVNLRDCESALKQIDVYALGLVLWELGTRCTDMQNAEPAPYAPPFHKEAGDNPSLEQMQTLVSKRKARPLWPTSWKDTAAARLLCETAEDCWDQDAEARLTSLCVEERLLELPTLRGRVLHPMHPPVSPTPLINNNHIHDHNINSSSVGTVETLLSASEENYKNSNQLAVCVAPIQPYQGRNPCLERNLLAGSSDSLRIDKSSKHCTNSESQNLITNDYLNYQINHRATPIPYLQNAVHAITTEKRYNNVNVIPKSKFKWSNLKKLFKNKRDRNHFSIRKDTQVKIVPGKLVNSFGQNGVTTSLLTEKEVKRPSSLHLNKDTNGKCNLAGISQVLRRRDSVSRERSLEHFSEVFTSTSDLSRLKDPAQRVKTPGDVPPSVRRTRGKAAKESSARFSLYDDRMMAQWGSAPDLEPTLEPLRPAQINDLLDRDSVSSF